MGDGGVVEVKNERHRVIPGRERGVVPGNMAAG